VIRGTSSEARRLTQIDPLLTGAAFLIILSVLLHFGTGDRSSRSVASGVITLRVVSPISETVVRVLRWVLYVAIYVVTAAISLSGGLWPPGGPDTRQARDVGNLLLAVIGIVGLSVGVVFLTAPRVPPG
jgi:hypothetical protein